MSETPKLNTTEFATRNGTGLLRMLLADTNKNNANADALAINAEHDSMYKIMFDWHSFSLKDGNFKRIDANSATYGVLNDIVIDRLNTYLDILKRKKEEMPTNSNPLLTDRTIVTYGRIIKIFESFRG